MYDNHVEALFTGIPQCSALARMKLNFQTLLRSVPLVSGYIFEQADGKNFCDISLRLSKCDGSLSYFLHRVATEKRYQHLQQSAIWRRSLTFLGNHSEHFNDCWLEFDDSSLLSGSPVPSLFVNPASLSSRSFTNAFEQLSGKRLPFAGAIKVLNICSPGYLHFVGLMLSRNESAIRLCIKVKRGEAGALLQKLPVTINWLPEVDEVVLSMDVADNDILPRIGIEYPVATGEAAYEIHRKLSGRPVHWPGVWWKKDSDRLTEVLAGNKVSVLPLADSQWLFSRRINHFKQIFDSGRELELKTYSYLALGWLPKRQELRVFSPAQKF